MQYGIVFTPEAEEQLAEIYRYIAIEASPVTAERYVSAIISSCEDLRSFPLRGMPRDDIRPGLRVTNHRKRAVIVYAVEAGLVSIVGVFYGGQDYETALQPGVDSDG